jgi:hypothetical protein
VRCLEAYVPKAARRLYTPIQWRHVIRLGMSYRRTRRFSPTFVHRDRHGVVVAIEENEWIDLGGEGGLA